MLKIISLLGWSESEKKGGQESPLRSIVSNCQVFQVLMAVIAIRVSSLGAVPPNVHFTNRWDAPLFFLSPGRF